MTLCSQYQLAKSCVAKFCDRSSWKKRGNGHKLFSKRLKLVDVRCTCTHKKVEPVDSFLKAYLWDLNGLGKINQDVDKSCGPPQNLFHISESPRLAAYKTFIEYPRSIISKIHALDADSFL